MMPADPDAAEERPEDTPYAAQFPVRTNGIALAGCLFIGR